jgi:hypothetical protein
MKDKEKLNEIGDKKIITKCINPIGWHLTIENFSLTTLFPT